jgi:acetyl esterase/lipase
MRVRYVTDWTAMARPLARIVRLAFLASLALAGLFGGHAAQASAAPLELPLLKPAPAVAPVAAPLSAEPVGAAPRGTMIMVHAGGWAGHDAHAQRLLMDRPGDLLLARGWRVVSVDYEEGPAGLQDVLDAAGSELARSGDSGPVCLYGESAGAHLALVAAERLRAIDCVVGLGTPTDLPLYTEEASTSLDARIKLVASQITRLFGSTLDALAPWNLVSLAPKIHADVLLMREGDDDMISPEHDARFRAARPTTQAVGLEPGNRSDPSTSFVHGTVSDAGRAHYAAALGAFADRAIAAHEAERIGARTGCSGVGSSLGEVGLTGLRASLRCLARKDSAARTAGSRSWKRTSVTLRGEVNAARVWTSLRRTTGGRRALAAAATRRAKLTVSAGDRSRVVLRATR